MGTGMMMRQTGSVILAAVMLASAQLAMAADGAPVNLRCEYRLNPLGIDVMAPRLSWELSDQNRGAAQTAYQILIATDTSFAAAGLIDTGEVKSDQSAHVTVTKLKPESGRRYHWKVRTWNTNGQPSDYSEPAWFEMGLLKAEDWKAKWVAAPSPQDQEPKPAWGEWIWSANAPKTKATVFFRLPIDIDPSEKVDHATIRLTADNSFALFVNEQKRGAGNNWQDVQTFGIGDDLRAGHNIISVRAVNTDGPAGLMAAGRIVLAGGKVIEFRTGKHWKTSLQQQEGWNTPDFDDSRWEAAAVVTAYGGEPWKELKEPVGARRSMCLRKDFTVKGEVVRARAYVSGLGLYELRINGKRVGEDEFTPGWTHYPRRVQYQTYDVTELLKAGNNTVGAVLGNGWWSGGLGWKGAEQYSEGPLRFVAQLSIEHADGSSEVVVTDASWKTAPSPITRNSLYGGEAYDATLEMPGWDAPDFDAAKWQPVTPAVDQASQLVAQVGETIRVTQELPARQITQPEKDVFIADFGQNVSARVRLKVAGPRGTRVRLRFAEVLTPEGQLYRDNYRTAEATDVYILKGGGEEVWEPRFTYRGFRFCEITGFPGVPGPSAVTSRVVHSAMESAGRFECSNWLLNTIATNIVWGQRSNLFSVPTDCPQRDERLGWMGDAQAFAPTASWNMQMAGFFTKWMRDITDSQGKDGHVTDVSPVIVVKGPAAPGWGDAVVTVPWAVYQFYGDTRIIEENYGAMAGWVEYMLANSKNYLYEREGYGDWVATVASPKKPIGAAYFYHSTNLLAKMAAAVGKTEDAAKYTDLAAKIAAAFNKAYLDPKTSGYPGGTQTANLLPLWFGITPEESRAAVFANIVKDVEARGGHLSTGFLGTPCLLPALSAYGRHDLAYQVMATDTFPSLGYMARNGATTIWELWDTDKQGPGMNSRNHFAFGSMGEWLFEDLAGIRTDPAKPGFKHSVIHPRPVGDLVWAKAEYRTLYGAIGCTWRRTDGGLAITITIPPNTTSEVRIPLPEKGETTITESGKPVLSKGAGSDNVAGVRFVKTADGCAVFDVKAGTYEFAVRTAQ